MGAQIGIDFPVFHSDEDVVVTDGTLPAVVPKAMEGRNLTYAIGATVTPSSNGSINIQIRRVRNGSTANMLNTEISIAENANYAVSTDIGNSDIIEGDLLYVDVKSAGTGAQGLTVTLVFA